jgi:hypothetical protein
MISKEQQFSQSTNHPSNVLTKEETRLLKYIEMVYPFLSLQDFLNIFLVNSKYRNIHCHEPNLFIYLIRDFYNKQEIPSINMKKFFKSLIKRFHPLKEIPELYRPILQRLALSLPIDKNLIKNHSGKKGFEGWEIIENGGNQWAINDWGTQLPRKTCFVTSYDWCVMSKTVKFADLKEESRELFFENKALIKAGCYIAKRWDCGAEGYLQVQITDSDHQVLKKQKITIEDDGFPAGNTGSHSVYRRLEVEYEHEEGKIPNNIIVTIGGKDTQFWAGHYGARFSNVYVMCDLKTN